MQLIQLHHHSKASNFIEGFHENYECITLWNDSDDLQIISNSFFDYTPENRVTKYTNPFR